MALLKQHVIANSQAESPCLMFSQPPSMMALLKQTHDFQIPARKSLSHIFTTPINDGITEAAHDSQLQEWYLPLL